eukprot:11795671-Prorocentrum_lima.AAC.1
MRRKEQESKPLGTGQQQLAEAIKTKQSQLVSKNCGMDEDEGGHSQKAGRGTGYKEEDQGVRGG